MAIEDIPAPSPDVAEAPLDPAQPAPASSFDLFRTFVAIGLMGFGGVLPWAQRVLVEDKRWLTPRQFLEVLSLSQIVPGPNIVNVAVTVGMRYFGGRGAAAAVCGLLAMPLVIMFGLIGLYERFGELETVEAAFRGVSSAAAGLLVAMALKLVWPLLGQARALVIGGLTIVAVAVLRLPLPIVLAVMAPASLLWVWVERRGR